MVSRRPGGANVPPFDAVADPRKYAVVRDDFVGGLVGTLDDTHTGIGALGWKVTDIVGAGDSDIDIVATAATTINHPGVISLNTGPTTPAANDEAGLSLATGSVSLPSSGLLYMAAQVRFPSVTAVEFNFGLFDTTFGAGRGTDSISIELDVSADTDFNFVTNASSSATASAFVEVAAVDTWYTLEIAADASTAYAWINGEAIDPISTNIPSGTALTPAFKVATETTAEKSVLIDWFVMRQPTNRKGFTGVGG